MDVPIVAPPSAPPRRASWRDRLRLRRARGVDAGADVVVGRGVVFDIARGGRLEIGDGAVLGARCRFHVGAAGVVRIGAEAVLGERCAVVAERGVQIGARAVLADEVVVVDGAARFDDAETPVRLQGLRVAAVMVGDGVRVGPGAVIGPGVVVGERAVVGAHAVVEADVAEGAVVDGVPGGREASARARLASSPDAARGARVVRDH